MVADLALALVTWACTLGEVEASGFAWAFQKYFWLTVMFLGTVACGCLVAATPRWRRTGIGMLIGLPLPLILLSTQGY